MSWSNRRLLLLWLRLLRWLLRDTALSETWLAVEAQQVQQVGRLLLRRGPSTLFRCGRVRSRHVGRHDVGRMVWGRAAGGGRKDGRRDRWLLVMRVLLLAGGGSSTAAVEPLEQLLQTGISHNKGDLDDLLVR